MSEQDREKFKKVCYPNGLNVGMKTERGYTHEFDSSHVQHAWLAWQAATAEANKRIAEVESEVAQLNANWMMARTDRDHAINRWNAIGIEKAQLQHSNNTLREALLHASRQLDLLQPSSTICKIVSEALTATPAESLQAHDDEVIEKCAKALKGEYYLAEDIRALKGK